MTVAGTWNFVSRTNAIFTERLTYFDDDNNPVPMAGWSGLLEVKANPGDTTAIFTFSTADGTMTLGTADGSITLFGSLATMAAVAPFVGVHDLRLSSSPSLPDVIVDGSWTHKQGVSD